jgi:hypothetical protein
MKAQTYKYVLALLAVTLVGTSYAILSSHVYSIAETGGEVQGIKYTGTVCKQVTRANGVEEPQFCDHNILFLVGKNFTTSQLFSAPSAAGATPITNISLGNGTSAINQIYTPANFGGIPDCGLDPTDTLSWINIPNSTSGYIDSSGNVSANYKWTSTCGSGTGERVNQTLIGLTTNAFAANTFTDVYLQANDQLNVTWYVWIT